ncbi:hypothetical protein IKF34_00530 [Candidatus Saccharibacteria bacterium]|nr:hypothetical protein [Candidatus Saccharibacteria bacterium]
MKTIEEVKGYTVSRMLAETEDSTMAKTLFEVGIMDNNDTAIYPALADLLEREADDIIKESLYESLANRELVVNTTRCDELMEFILDNCQNRHSELYKICEDLANAETLGDFLEKRHLFAGKSTDTGEDTLIAY